MARRTFFTSLVQDLLTPFGSLVAVMILFIVGISIGIHIDAVNKLPQMRAGHVYHYENNFPAELCSTDWISPKAEAKIVHTQATKSTFQIDYKCIVEDNK